MWPVLVMGARVRSAHAVSRHTISRLPVYLCDLVPDSPGIRRFSALYLTSQDSELFRQKTERALSPPELNNVEDLRSHLSARTATDFEHGRTVELDGWILSRTEADSLALATLYRTG